MAKPSYNTHIDKHTGANTMTSKTAAVLGFLGFLLTAFGVGGIENSITDSELLASMLVSITGLAIMYAAVAALKVADYYDNRY